MFPNSIPQDKRLTTAFWTLVVVVLAIVDTVTESHDRDTLGAFAATSPVWQTLLICSRTMQPILTPNIQEIETCALLRCSPKRVLQGLQSIRLS